MLRTFISHFISRKTPAILLMTLCIFSLYARIKIVEGSDCWFMIEYEDLVQPGDPVYMNITLGKTRDGKYVHPVQPHMKLIRNTTGKTPGETDLFLVKENEPVYYGAIPLSTWLAEGEFTLLYTYSDSTGIKQTVSLPVDVNMKKFVSEDIPLNSANTAIKTDSSPQRAAQIDKLNGILATVNEDAVYYDGPFMRPVDSNSRSSFFGDRRTYLYSTGGQSVSEHYGIDFDVPTGTTVMACGSGKVVLAETRVSTGWSVVIEHLPGLYSLYYHMDSLAVKEGDMVEKGNVIGRSGSTGLATGPHLHWEVRLNMSAVNPDFFTYNELYRP